MLGRAGEEGRFVAVRLDIINGQNSNKIRPLGVASIPHKAFLHTAREVTHNTNNNGFSINISQNSKL